MHIQGMPGRIRWARVSSVGWIGLVASGLILAGCAKKPDDAKIEFPEAPVAKMGEAPELRESQDPFGKVYAARIEAGKVLEFQTIELGKDAVVRERLIAKKEKTPPTRSRDKVHPLLRKRLAERGPAARESVVVTFKDDLVIPRFPEPAVDESRDSKTNRAARARAESIVSELRERRATDYDRLRRDMTQYKAKVTEDYWLIRALSAEMPLGALGKLAERQDVLTIEPRFTENVPPQDANPNNDVDDGRAQIVSDPYFNLGQNAGWIGLLDTGVRATHQLFNSPDHLAFLRDCVNGGPTCNSGAINPADDCWDHGTSSAAIITGNGRLGNAYRGVTAISLDSWKIYPTSFNAAGACNGFLDTGATLRAFQRAVAVLDRVIVGELQAGGDHLSAISLAADAAYDAGAVIVSANGNNGPNAGTVNAPANAHRVLGVGNFSVTTGNQITSQSRGPTGDNRIKPDVQAPTNTETAENGSDTDLGTFGGTSGATPYASGAAALLRNWLRGNSGSIDPGQVYAQMILSGQQPSPFNNTSGAGRINLPTNGWAWWGKVSVRDGDTINIPLNISAANANTLDGALWWPEFGQRFLFITIDIHNDIDLRLVDPGGTTRDSSLSIPSVFERARVAGSVANGIWTLRISGFDVNTSSQTVYWAAHVRTR